MSPCKALCEQAVLTEELSIAIGTVNGRLKRWVEQGSIEVRRDQQQKLRNIITPEGYARLRFLTDLYVQ